MQITLRALNKGYFRNELIGAMSFSLDTVYFSDKHTVEHSWFALANPESEQATKIFGMLKASITVQGPAD